ncbi:MAG: DUF3540 domain-containing protein [Polyangiaceae bacterium]|jgi:hypothetical protein|nr:DUF3540 domain-containing protein [Polyangiaceae bacterium]MBK8941288.1 DUF3540 domain-containing protein [Polyangiaceae bacterium]
MLKPAIRQPIAEAAQLEGVVRRVEVRAPALVGSAAEPPEGRYVVDSGAGELVARRAVGCLVAPLEGDLVLVARLSDGRAYVLSVLERDAEAPLSLESERSILIKSSRGRVDVAAEAAVCLTTAGALALTSVAMTLSSGDTELRTGTLDLEADRATARLDRITVVAGLVESVFDTLSQRLKRSRRVVETIDQVRAETLDLIAGNAARIHAKCAVLTADQLVKVDGEQIHIG